MAFPSTFADITTAVIAKLRLDSTNDTSRVHDWINQVYAQVAVETGNTVNTTTISCVSGTSNYTLSSSVEAILGAYVTPVGANPTAPLQPRSLDWILRKRQAGGGASTATGPVTDYALLGINRLEVYPTPSAADTITIYYAGLPTALSANGDTPTIHEPWASKLLEYGALAEAADFLNHPDEPKYRTLYEGWMTRYINHLNRKGPKPDQLELRGDYVYPPHDPSTDLR